MNSKFSVCILILSMGISIDCFSQQKKQFNYQEFKERKKTEIKISKNDRVAIESTYHGDMEKYLAYRRKWRKKIIESSSWEKESYILIFH